MFDKELFERLNDESGLLTGPDEARLDEALANQTISGLLMKALPEEQPSMAWRSLLNERILAIAAASKRRSRWLSIWRPAIGLGLAGALAVVFMVNRPSQRPVDHPRARVESGLVEAHQMSVEATEIAGPGLAQHEAIATQKNDDLYDWSESDIETL